MASTSGVVPDDDSSPENKLKELKQSIVDGKTIDAETVGKIFETIFTLKAERDKSPVGFVAVVLEEGEAVVPEEFLCPLSRKMMTDPVIIASGQTFDRPSIENWRKSGYRTCPHTNKFLFHDEITPNHLLRRLISKWCKSHGLPELAEPLVEEQPTRADRKLFSSLHMRLSFMSPSEQKEAANELGRLTKERPIFRALYAEDHVFITQLLDVLPLPGTEIDHQLHEAVITIVLNILSDERNKKFVGECHMGIPVLTQALESKKLMIRCKAAAAVHQMSSLEINKEIIGNSSVLKLVIELLKERGNLIATENAITAISSLCENEANVGRAVRLGAVFAVTQKLVYKRFNDELLHILMLFSSQKQACEELERLKYVPVLLSIVKGDPSDVSKENAILILHNVFENNRRIWKNMVKQAEENRATIFQISEHGSPKAKKKAADILENLNKDTATSSSSTPP